MGLDVSDAGDQRSFGNLIPDGSFVKLIMNIKAGGVDIPSGDPAQDQLDRGLFTRSGSSDAIGLNCEFTVMAPADHLHRKLFSWMTVSGGEVDEKGQSKGWLITKATLRAIVLSATGTRSDDRSEPALANQKLGGFRHLDNVPFWAKLRIEPGGENKKTGGVYPDKNVIDRVVIPDDEEYAALRTGTSWPAPKPRNAPHAGGGQKAAPSGPAAAKPRWQSDTPAPAATTAPATTASAPAASPPAGPKWLTR